MRKELTHVEADNLLKALNIEENRRDFFAELLKDTLRKSEGKAQVICKLWNNPELKDNELALTLFIFGCLDTEKQLEQKIGAGFLHKLKKFDEVDKADL